MQLKGLRGNCHQVEIFMANWPLHKQARTNKQLFAIRNLLISPTQNTNGRINHTSWLASDI